VRVLVGLATLGSLLMAAAVPEAFGRYAPTFAGTYVAIHLLRSAVLLTLLRRHRLRRRSLRFAFWFTVTGVLWIAGAVAPVIRIPLWTLADDLRAVGSHLSERLQQIFLISVGELILLVGTSYSDAGQGRARSVAFALSFVNAVLLAFIYYVPAGRGLGEAVDESEYPAAVGQDAVLLHLALIAGVLSTAVGDELIITGADRPVRVPVVAAALSGTALFLAARIVLSVRTYRRLSLPRLLGVFVVIAVMPLAFRRPRSSV
jgi:low temperature requirement protein LtrA